MKDWLLEKVTTYPAMTVATTGAVVQAKRVERTPVACILGVPADVGEEQVRAWAKERKLIPALMPETVAYVVSSLEVSSLEGVLALQWEE